MENSPTVKITSPLHVFIDRSLFKKLKILSTHHEVSLRELTERILTSFVSSVEEEVPSE